MIVNLGTPPVGVVRSRELRSRFKATKLELVVGTLLGLILGAALVGPLIA
jgi:hypothetical protein